MENQVDKARITKIEEKKQKERKEKFRKLTVEKEMEIVRMVEEKQDKEKDLIEIRIVELEGPIST